MYRFRQRVMMVVLFAVLAWMGVAQETPPPPQSPAPTHQDAPAPKPHPELKPLVEDIRTLLRDDKFQDALPKTDELLQQARRKATKSARRTRCVFGRCTARDAQDHTRPVARGCFGVGVGVGVVA
jgi:hypothetical protein